MEADRKTKTEVEAVLERVANAYASRDLDALMGCFAADADVVMYGTGADEKRVGPREIEAQAERDWAQTESAAMVFDSMSISAAGTVAWAAVDGAFDLRVAGQAMRLPARITFVLEQRDRDWRIVHAHFSMPHTGQQEGRSV